MSVDILRELYKISIETLFPTSYWLIYRSNPKTRYIFSKNSKEHYYTNREGNVVKYNNIMTTARKQRMNNTNLFLSKFYDFYISLYEPIRSVCAADTVEVPENITYILPGELAATNKFPVGRVIPNLETYKFPDNGLPIPIVSQGMNILIVGAGPVGLYLAGLLKASAPQIEVNIVEKRVSDDRQRTLTRSGKVFLKEFNIDNQQNALNKMNELFAKSCALFQEFFIGVDPTYKIPSLLLLNHIKGISTEYTSSIGSIELLLANFAQKVGVNIYHDNKITDIEYIESNYVNPNTAYVFDTTGGRLIKGANINAQFQTIREEKKNHNEVVNRKTLAGTLGKPFNVKEGTLTPEQAVFQRGSYIYLALGETFIKIDYNEGKSIVFGAVMSVAILLTILRELQPKVAGGKRVNKTRRRRP